MIVSCSHISVTVISFTSRCLRLSLTLVEWDLQRELGTLVCFILISFVLLHCSWTQQASQWDLSLVTQISLLTINASVPKKQLHILEPLRMKKNSRIRAHSEWKDANLFQNNLQNLLPLLVYFWDCSSFWADPLWNDHHFWVFLIEGKMHRQEFWNFPCWLMYTSNGQHCGIIIVDCISPLPFLKTIHFSIKMSNHPLTHWLPETMQFHSLSQ